MNLADRIREMLRANPKGMTTPEMADIVGQSTWDVSCAIVALSRNLVFTDSPPRGGDTVWRWVG